MAFKDFFGGIVSGVGSIFNTISQSASNRAQAKENEKNRQFALDMWNKENEYNLPKNQIGRFQSAGLNPALVYGQGTSTLAAHAGTPSTSNQFNAPQIDTNSALQGYFASKQLQNETKVADSQEFMNNTQANKNIEEANYYEEQTGLLKKENSVRGQMLQIELEKRGLELSNLNIENTIKLATQNTEIASKVTQLEKLAADKEVTTQEVKIKMQELENLVAQLSNIKKEGEYIEAKTETEKTAQLLNMSQAQLNKSASALNYALAKNQSYIRKHLSAQAYSEYMQGRLAESGINLNKSQRDKLIIDTYNAFKNGELDRLIKSTSQRYGTGTVGIAIGASLDFLKNFLPGAIKDIKDTFTGDYDWSKDILLQHIF